MNQISQYFGKNPKKIDLSDGSKQVAMISRNHEKVAQEVTLMKQIFLRRVLSHLTVRKFCLTV